MERYVAPEIAGARAGACSFASTLVLGAAAVDIGEYDGDRTAKKMK